MNLPSLFFAIAACFTAIEIQMKAHHVIHLMSRIRLEVMASLAPCPILSDSSGCAIRVEARRAGGWDYCDASRSPSGAELPMHRWFRVTGHCLIRVYGLKVQVPIPQQVILR